MQMSVAELIVERLRDWGVSQVFALGGGALIPIHAAAFSRMNVVNATHESGAVFMADGFHRATGQVPAVMVTAGPGTTNCVTGLANAAADFIPMVFISAQVPTVHFGLNAFQESTELAGVDTVRLLEKVCRFSARIATAAEVVRVVDKAMAMALAIPQGPVHLNVPFDVAREKVGPHAKGDPPHFPSLLIPKSVAHQQAMLATLEILADRKGVAILAGYGTMRAKAFAEVVELADALDADLFTTPKAKASVLSESARLIGCYGFPGNEIAISALHNSSCYSVLILLGTRLGQWSSLSWDSRLWLGRKVIWIDAVERQVLGRLTPDVMLCGDLKVVLAELLDKLGRNGSKPPVNRLLKEAKDLESVQPATEKAAWCDRPKGGKGKETISPVEIVEVLNSMINSEMNIFIDIGNSMLWTVPELRVKKWDTLHVNFGFGAMGFATAAVIGAAVGAPERQSIAVVGDGAFLMNGSEVWTSVQQSVAAVWIVLNDGGYGMLDQVEHELSGRSLTHSRFGKILNISRLAEAYGAKGVIVANKKDFALALRSALSFKGAVVIDARIDPACIPKSLGVRCRELGGEIGV